MEENKFQIPPEGIYLMQIVDVFNNKAKQYLRLTLDWNDPESQYYERGKSAEENFGNKWSYVNIFLSYKESVSKSFWWKIANILEENKINFKDNVQKVIDSGYSDLIGLECYWNLTHEQYQNKNGDIRNKFGAFPELILKSDIEKATKKKKPKAKAKEPEQEAVDAFAEDMPF